jgi:hypothetical protein
VWNDIVTYYGVASLPECQLKCQANNLCNFFSYGLTTLECWLKTGNTSWVLSAGAVSGPKICHRYDGLLNICVRFPGEGAKTYYLPKNTKKILFFSIYICRRQLWKSVISGNDRSFPEMPKQLKKFLNCLGICRNSRHFRK